MLQMLQFKFKKMTNINFHMERGYMLNDVIKKISFNIYYYRYAKVYKGCFWGF